MGNDSFKYSADYYGYMKQPFNINRSERACVYYVADKDMKEIDVILLTPCAFNSAYELIVKHRPSYVRLFTPSMRPEFISDVVNLYLIIKNICPIRWVYPDKMIKYRDLELGQDRLGNHTNIFNTALSITYLKNRHVEDLYDIMVKTPDATHVFTQCACIEGCTEAYHNKDISFIHLPMSSTIYGGITYLDIIKDHFEYRRKFIPNCFSSIDELRAYLNGRYERFRKGYK